jgi:hypothetical protein
MNLIAAIIGALSFGETGGRAGSLARKAYFAVAYNTMFPVNAKVALGSVTPYLAVLWAAHQLSWATLIPAVVITAVSAYFYGLIYIVNDLIDRRKDQRLSIPKLNARHVLGEGYLAKLAAGYVLVTALCSLAWPRLGWPLTGYGVALMALSAVHSYAGKWKALTIFVERWAKFCSPLALLAVATAAPQAVAALVAAMLVYPLGFTLDYAYQGYLRDRLKMSSQARFGLYGAYWALVAGTVTAVVPAGAVVSALPVAGLYALVYFLTVSFSNRLAEALPLGFLDAHYEVPVALEKRRYVAYGLVQLSIIAMGVAYAGLA